MPSEPPFVLTLPVGVSVLFLAALLLLFVLRVAGHLIAATIAPPWLPPMARWYSGVMSYRYLLPTQLVFVVLMAAVISAVRAHASPLGAGSPVAGAAIVWASYLYAIGMVVRAIRYARATPERRGVLIPILFHFVLAAFLFVWGSALAR